MRLILEKRLDSSAAETWRIRAISLTLALAAGALLLLMVGANPITTYRAMIVGALGTPYAISETLVKAIPLMLTGLAVAVPTGWALRRHLIPERLVPLVGITAALIAFAAADALAKESGLLATTVLGLALANRKELRTKPIIQFSEVLQTLLVGLLFIILSARLTRDQLSEISIGVVGLVLVLVLVARPLAAWLATWRSEFSLRERGFIA